ncbi:unnamed protein product [Cunninghamella blakesleeana]
MDDAQPITSPRTHNIKQHLRKQEIKRSKTSFINKSPLHLKLNTLDKEKLLNILSSLLDTHSDLQTDIMTYIPPPTIPSALAVLYDMEKKFHQSFPFNRYGPKKDKYTYSRVRIPLLDLIDTLTQYSHYFVSASLFPPSLFTYLDQVTHFAHRLPIWDNEENNQARRDLYNDLSLFWKQAIQTTFNNISNGSVTFPSDTISNWAKSLANHNMLANGLLDEAVHEFTRSFFSNPTTFNHHSSNTSNIISSSSSSFNSSSSTTPSSLDTTVPPPICHSPALDMLPSPVVSYAYLQR